MNSKILGLLAISLLIAAPASCQSGPSDYIELRVSQQEKKVDVLVAGQLFTSYVYSDDLKKPVLWPVISAGGQILTRSYPVIDKVGDRVDHPHHLGVWFNYGNVNGLDFWNNSKAIAPEKRDQYGTIYHRSIEKSISGKEQAILETTAIWKSPDGIVLLEEYSNFQFQAVGNRRIVDRFTTLKSVFGEVVFNDSKEGMFAIRVARELELPIDKPTRLVGTDGNIIEVSNPDNLLVNGNYLSSNGIEGKEVWGTRGRWMRLAGELNEERVTLVIIDHPDNVGYPTYWHARDYGLFAANPLGQKAFTKGKNQLNYSLNENEIVTFKYRLVIDSGTLTDKEINKLADDFAKVKNP